MQEDNALKAVVKSINKRRYRDIVDALDNEQSGYNQMMEELRYHSIAQEAWKSDGKKGVRLLAALTPEQDAEFQKVYGVNYYRDPNFFKKQFPQTLALNRHEL